MCPRFPIILVILISIVLSACGSSAEPAAPTAPATAAPTAPATAPATAAPTDLPALEPTALPAALPTAEPTAETTAPDADVPIQPGDQLGSFTITTAGEGEATFGWDGDCQELPKVEGDATVRYACALTTAQKFNPCSAAYSFGSGKTLDEIWAEFKYELKINGRPVNLEAFGTVDFMHPQVGEMRAYNLVIVAAQPGEIVIEDVTTMPGAAPIRTTATITFTAP